MCEKNEIYVLLDGWILESFPTKKLRRKRAFELLDAWGKQNQNQLREVNYSPNIIAATVVDTGDILPEIEDISVYSFNVDQKSIYKNHVNYENTEKVTSEIYNEWPKMMGINKGV